MTRQDTPIPDSTPTPYDFPVRIGTPEASPAPDASPVTATPREKVDVVIVGAGASGSVMAAVLAEAGRSVLLLDGGPDWSQDDMISSQLWARRLKWTGPPIQSGGENPIGINFNMGWGTGGAAIHHYAVWFRFHESDFRLNSEFGVGLDWPITYDDLRPYYDRVQAEIGLCGDAEQEVWRPPGEPYPMPPIPPFAQGEAIIRSFDSVGMRHSPIPLAITTQEYNGRPACIFDGWCDAGCPIGALGNPLEVYLPRAFNAGAQLQNNSRVVRVLTNETGTRATGVEYITPDGQRIRQEADAVVLAAFVVPNASILLSSASSHHPEGLANSSGLVGSYVMAHPSRAVYGLFPERTDPYFGVTGGQVTSQDTYEPDPAKGFIGGNTWLCANTAKPNDLIGFSNARADIFGNALHDFIRRASHHFAGMIALGGNHALPENRITLTNETDLFGEPVPRVEHRFTEDDLAAVDAAIEQGTRAFEGGGADDVWTSALANQHHMGGTIMGADPNTSVTTDYGQTHDVENLIIAGPGLFPSSAAVNPTFTIHAVTLRSAEWIRDNWSSLV